MNDDNHIAFNSFKSDTAGIQLPQNFTFPFYYDPHPLAETAAKELQNHIITQNDWAHNFGLPENDLTLQDGITIGKMFGVLVVQNLKGELGYLAAFSGKIAESNHHQRFVPPVYDMLKEGDFFRKGGEKITAINKKIEVLEESPDYVVALDNFKTSESLAKKELSAKKISLRENKKSRKVIRKQGKVKLNEADFLELQEKLKDESLKQQYFFRKDVEAWDEKLNNLKVTLHKFSNVIDSLKEERKRKSNALQNRLFSEYQFLRQLRKSNPDISQEELDKKYTSYVKKNAGSKGDTGNLVADHTSYAGNYTQEVHGDDCKLVDGDYVRTIDGSYHLKITGDCHLEVSL